MEMSAKRPAYNAERSHSSGSVYSCVDEELHTALVTVGPRARKQVSDGHITRGSIPSFNGMAVGSLDQYEIRDQIGARPTQSMGNLPSKRNWESVYMGDIDEYGDTEDDEEALQNQAAEAANRVQSSSSENKQPHASFFPFGQRKRSGNMDDFEEATFLRPN